MLIRLSYYFISLYIRKHFLDKKLHCLAYSNWILEFEQAKSPFEIQSGLTKKLSGNTKSIGILFLGLWNLGV